MCGKAWGGALGIPTPVHVHSVMFFEFFLFWGFCGFMFYESKSHPNDFGSDDTHLLRHF